MKKFKLLITFILMIVFIVPVVAGIEAYRVLDVYIENAPSEEFYTDLVIDDGQNRLLSVIYRRDYDYEMWDTLFYNYLNKDEYLGMINGTYTHMSGDLIGELQKNGSYKYHYYGASVPNEFRIVTLTRSGVMKESAIIHKTMWFEKIIYDYESGKITYSNKLIYFAEHFICLLGIFLLIKNIFYSIVGLKKHPKLLQHTSIITVIEAIIIAPIITLVFMYNGNLGQGAVVMMSGSIIVTFIEFILFSKYYKIAGEVSIFSALGANILTNIVTIMLMEYAFTLFLL